MRRAMRESATAVTALALVLWACTPDAEKPTIPSNTRAFTGFTGNPDWEIAEGEPVGTGADGKGGVGVGGGALFLNATVTATLEDGTVLGPVKTDATTGMVTFQLDAGYRGTLLVVLQGGPGATYYDEGRDEVLLFPAGRALHAWVPAVRRNIGLTPFTEAAYQLLTAGSTPERVTGKPTAAQVKAANDRVRDLVNGTLPEAFQVDDLTRLPIPRGPKDVAGKVGLDPRGRNAMLDSAFTKQASLSNWDRAAPMLDAIAQLAEDLKDGRLDGRNAGAAVAAAAERTYDPGTLGGDLVAAMAAQAARFGKPEVTAALPRVVSFGNTRYLGYLFDGSVTREGEAYSTVSGWLAGNSLGRQPGQTDQKLAGVARTVGIMANMGHGGAFFKADTSAARPKVYALGDNINGELGLGNRTSTAGSALELTGLPLSITHAAGGFAHTVARLSDGSVFTWGDNGLGQLGLGKTRAELRRALLPQRVTLPRGALAVAATTKASYALLDDGTVWAWGSNAGFGLLGNGARDGIATSPAQVAGVSDVVQLAARDHDVVVLKGDGTVWQWGSFPADPDAFVPGDPSAPYTGGHLTPVQVDGLPAGVAVRRLLTEQGLFAALLENGHVYAWGVHFDLTAGGLLRDLAAERVLGLPPLRDLLPGGYIGYGVRAFDRLTALGVDYQGGFWKIRGRVAELFDPAFPALQRRPLGQSPRAECEVCHTFLDAPLAELLAQQPAVSGAECVPTANVHAGPSGSLVHAETLCIQCHNPARLVYPPENPSGVAPFAGSGGWPNCVTPAGLPNRIQSDPPIVAVPCTIPPRHVFTPPGTICSTCHASVIAIPLNQLVPACAQPGISLLPTLETTATVGGARNAGGQSIPDGGLTSTASPLVHGTVSAPLEAGESLAVSRNGVVAGDANVVGTGWTYADAVPSDGAFTYTARVVAGADFGATSNGFSLAVDATPPSAAVAVTGFVDDGVGAIAPGGFASDSTPRVTGTVGTLAAGEVVQVLRGGSVAGTATVSGSTWSFTEPAALAEGSYSYIARVADAAGNLGTASSAALLTIIGALPAVAITQATGNGVAVPSGGATTDTTPALAGTVAAPLQAGFVLRVYRGASLAGAASVTGTTWTFTEPSALADGTWGYTARVEAGLFQGPSSGAYTVVVDTVAPTQVANVTLVSDDFNGPLANGATTADPTPIVSGTLSVALATGERIRLLRGGTAVATFAAAGAAWSYTEPVALANGSYSYQAQVVDAVAQLGPLGATRSVVVDTSTVPLNGAATTLATINGVAPVASAVPQNNVRTPVLAGTIQRALNAGEGVRVFRDGAAVGTATVTSLSWTFTSASLADGTYSFRARIEVLANPVVFGQASATVSDPIDGTAPTQAATISAVYDDSGALVDVTGTYSTDLTPRVDGTLSAALGAGDFVRVVRDGAEVARLRPAGTTWTYTDTALALGLHTYGAEVRDDAGNVGTAPPATNRTVTLISASSLPSATITSAAVSGTGSPGRGNGTVVASGGIVPDATPTFTVTLGAPLPAGYQVGLLRDGVPVTAVPTCVSPCAVTDPGTTEGVHVWTARTFAGPVLGATGTGYTLTVDVTAPGQTVTIEEVRSDQAPNTTVAGGIPPNAMVANGGSTGDPTPIFRVRLSPGLGSGEQLLVRRGGTPVTVSPANVCGSNCWEFAAPTGLTVASGSSTAGLPAPLSTADTTTAFQSVGSASFVVRVSDPAGWEGPASVTWSVNVGYFRCSQARADAAYASPPHPAVAGGSVATPTSCVGCHFTPSTHAGSTFTNYFVAVPVTNPSYWCRRPP